MLVGICVLAIFLLPTVLGLSAEFDQECHILRTLDILESRLQEQDARLQLQETLLEQQQAQIFDLEANLTTFNQSKGNILRTFTLYVNMRFSFVIIFYQGILH